MSLLKKIKRKKPSKIIIATISGVIFLLLILIIGNLIFARQRARTSQPAISWYLEPTPEPNKIEGSLTPKNNSGVNNSATNPIPATKAFYEVAPILMYHYIETPSATTTLHGLYLDPKIFDAQLDTLVKNNYHPLFASELAADINSKAALTGKNIILTFDDGYKDFYTQVFPLLKKYNYKATLYVVVNALGTKGYLTRDQIKELAASGLVEIGSHSFNHPDLRSLKEKDAKFEISISKVILEEICGQPVTSFAYPFGYYKNEFFSIASTTGYTNAVSVNAGSRQGEQNIWLLSRLRPGERTGEALIKWLEAWAQAKY